VGIPTLFRRTFLVVQVEVEVKVEVEAVSNVVTLHEHSIFSILYYYFNHGERNFT
jgi:hypothetical protein